MRTNSNCHSLFPQDSEPGDEARPGPSGEAKRRKVVRETLRWKKKDLERVLPDWTVAPPEFLHEDLTPTKQFERFFDDEVLVYIVAQTERYAQQCGDHRFNTSVSEIRGFLGILFISGYAPLPRRPLYWENEEDVHNPAVAGAMPRNRFDLLMKYLHLADNQHLTQGDKSTKVRPLYDMLNKRFIKYFPLSQEVSIDESMVPYYGKHSMKQCIRGKPIRFGYKQWVLATPLGYAIYLSPYQGAAAGYDKTLGLGHSVVVDLVSQLPPSLPFHVFIDNFFTGMSLLQDLTERGLGATGTVRTNRIDKCPLKQISKEERGAFDYRSSADGSITVCCWMDNSVVTMASNVHGVFPLQKVQRWSAKETKRINVDQPGMVKAYNKGMGGVDRMDQNVGAYRISMRTKKWWWPFLAFICDCALQNAWLLYRESPANARAPMDLLAFKRQVALTYTKALSASRSISKITVGRPAPVSRRVPEDLRFDGKDHYLDNGPTRRRCAQCGKKTKVLCLKCQIPCHIECSPAFHTP